jgi:hypothetical protein
MQPFQGKIRFGRKPKVGPSSQPWADGWNPVGILKSERAGLKWWAEKYVDNDEYCLKHKINIGGPLPS